MSGREGEFIVTIGELLGALSGCDLNTEVLITTADRKPHVIADVYTTTVLVEGEGQDPQIWCAGESYVPKPGQTPVIEIRAARGFRMH
jgi:hypothetical protein